MTFGPPPDGAFDDGLDEAARGLWRSAAESFADARRDAPDHPAPVLAQAVAQLHRGDADGACVTLETARALAGLDDDYWAPRARWLTVAARALAGDPAEAERLAQALPRTMRLRALAHLWLAEGRHQAGVEALLISLGRRPTRAELAGR
ncbi:MAG: hypothetical protein KC613_28065 [Myxococcales bacterium]|nr:hypothetical protein [Myxococcales bacterium]